MELNNCENFINKGIRMYKKISSGGLFSSPTYDSKIVFDLDEAVHLNTQGWDFENYQEVFCNLALMLYRDLKNLDK